MSGRVAADRAVDPRLTNQRATAEEDSHAEPLPSLSRDVLSVIWPVLGLAGGVYLAIVADPLWIKAVLILVVTLVLAMMRLPTLKRVLLATIIIEIPVQADVWLGLDIQASADNAVSGFNLSVTTACLLILYILWGMERLGKGPSGDDRWRAGIPTLAYFAVVVGSVLVAQDVMRSLYEIVLLGQAVLLFFYLLHAIRTRADVVFAMTFLLITVIIQGVLTSAVALLGFPGLAGPGTVNSLGDRLGGTLGHPNTLGAYLILLLVPAMASFSALPTRSHRLLGAVAFASGAIALVLSASRGAWAGSAISLTVFVVIGLRRGWLDRRILALILLSGLVVVALSLDQILERLGEWDNGAAQARLPLMTLASRVIGDAPVFGVGSNNFAVAMKQYLTVDFTSAWISTVHNKYLLVWGETGIVGLAAFLWFLISALRTGLRARHWNDPLLSPLAVGFACALLGSMVHMTVAIYNARPHVHTIWLVAAIITAIGQLGPSPTHPQADQPLLTDQR